jgi:hypothetical protein
LSQASGIPEQSPRFLDGIASSPSVAQKRCDKFGVGKAAGTLDQQAIKGVGSFGPIAYREVMMC